MPTLSLLLAPQVVVMTACDATSNNKVGIMITFGFQCVKYGSFICACVLQYIPLIIQYGCVFVVTLSRLVFFLRLSKVSANERRRYICNVFSHWLRPGSATERKRTPFLPIHMFTHNLQDCFIDTVVISSSTKCQWRSSEENWTLSNHSKTKTSHVYDYWDIIHV